MSVVERGLSIPRGSSALSSPAQPLMVESRSVKASGLSRLKVKDEENQVRVGETNRMAKVIGGMVQKAASPLPHPSLLTVQHAHPRQKGPRMVPHFALPFMTPADKGVPAIAKCPTLALFSCLTARSDLDSMLCMTTNRDIAWTSA